jgi:hypothetical protein
MKEAQAAGMSPGEIWVEAKADTVFKNALVGKFALLLSSSQRRSRRRI